MARTERESDRRRREEKWQTCWCCRDQQRACRMAQASAEKLEQTGPAEKERVASVPQRESSWQERRSRPCQKKKEQSRLSRVPDHEGGESQGGRERLSLTACSTSADHQALRRAFDAAERNGRFGRIHYQRGKESSCRGKRKRRVFLCRRTVRVKVGGKVIPASFLKIEGRGTLVGAKDWKERDG